MKKFFMFTAVMASVAFVGQHHATAQQNQPNNTNPLRLSVGAGAAFLPEYLGSDKMDYLALPLVEANYAIDERQSVFLGVSKGLGYGYKLNETVEAGVKAGYRMGRDTSDDAILAGMSDIDGAVEMGPWLTLKNGNARFLFDVMFDVSDEHNGYLAHAGGDYTFNLMPCVDMVAGAGLHFGSDNFNETYFNTTANPGIGRAAYGSREGLVDLYAKGGVNVRMTDRWSANFTAIASQLQREAKDSPVVQDEMQFMGLAGVSYRIY